MDDRATGISRAPCNLPKEAQGFEPCAADGCTLYMDGTSLEATEGSADDPKRGSLSSIGRVVVRYLTKANGRS